MRRYFILTVLCFSSLIAFGQKLELKKASPFTAVKWEKEQPIVQFENNWYHFEKLDHLNKNEIIAFCKKQFGNKWQKRFSEDLVEVLHKIGYQPNINVTLQLSQNGILKTYTGTFTFKNRQQTLQYNNAKEISISTLSRKLTMTKALTDIKQFGEILNSKSSYAQLSSFDYVAALKKVSRSIKHKKEDVDTNELVNELGKIMSEIGDRHSSIRNEAFNKKRHKTYNLMLSFGVASIDEKMVAIKQHQPDDDYSYYDNAYPYIKSIDGVAIETLIDSYNYRSKKAPIQAKRSRGSSAIQKYGELLFKNNIACPDSVTVVFSDGTSEKKETVLLTTAKKEYTSKVLQTHNKNRKKIENGNFNDLSKRITKHLGYIHLPEMYHYDEVEGLEAFIKETMKTFSDTKALIIDIRNNPGGGRELLQTFAKYIVQPAQSPWVANVGYLKTDRTIFDNDKSMNARYLYRYTSKKFTDADRKAIDQFATNFEFEKVFDTSKFSSPFYMVLHHGKESYTQPIYILVNENSFSAATVFTSAFKGLPNVNIVGTTTDGSSGNSRVWHLKHSNIRVKVSTMLSFQRNGKTLDGHGTIPDIVIPADEAQILKGNDTQLKKLIELITNE